MRTLYIIRFGKNEIRFTKKKDFIEHLGKERYKRLLKEKKFKIYEHGKLKKVI
jgi:hypothetical protein